MTDLTIEIPEKLVGPLFEPHRYKVIKGGRGCVAAGTTIETPGGGVKIEDFHGGFIICMSKEGPVSAWAGPSVCYLPEPLYRVTMESGDSITATAHHRFLAPSGWVELGNLAVGCSLSRPVGSLLSPLVLSCGASRSTSPADVLHSMRIAVGWLYHCSVDYRLYDGQPLPEQETYLDALQELVGVQPHSCHASTHRGVQGTADRRGSQRSSDLQPSQSALPDVVERYSVELGNHTSGTPSELLSLIFQAVELSRQKTTHPSQVLTLAGSILDSLRGIGRGETHQMLSDMLQSGVGGDSCNLQDNCNHAHLFCQDRIESIECVGEATFYDVFVPFYNNYIAEGMIHHNSAKSWSVGRVLPALGMQGRKRILCAREIQKSIRDSSYKLISDQIELLGMSRHYDVLKTEIRGHNGTEFIFQGLGNLTAESIKSFEGIDIVWVEEAHTVSDRSWELLIPTIRKPGSELWITYNPDEETDPVDVRFIQNHPPDCVVVTMNWNDNPWFPDVLKAEKDYLYSVDPETASHVWAGQYRKVSDAQILRGRWKVKEFTPKDGLWDGPYHGIDFGFSQDAGTMVRLWIWEGDLYVEYEAAGLEVDTDELPALWDEIPGARNYVARADCSRPETISAVKRNGYNRVVACKKWKGCEEDGIDHLRTYKNIFIHPRCKLAQEEAKNWSWKKDRLTGDILRVTTGKFDNTWAAARYALEPIIMHGLKDKVEQEEEEFPGMPPARLSWMA